MLLRIVSSRLTTLVIVVSVAGCAGASSADGSSRAALPRPDRSMRVIGRDEVLAAAAGSAEDLLRRLRPQFLQARPARGRAGHVYATPLVYVNDIPEGGLEVLHLVPANSILDVTYVPAAEANSRFTRDHPAGAIVIRTRSAARPQ